MDDGGWVAATATENMIRPKRGQHIVAGMNANDDLKSEEEGGRTFLYPFEGGEISPEATEKAAMRGSHVIEILTSDDSTLVLEVELGDC